MDEGQPRNHSPVGQRTQVLREDHCIPWGMKTRNIGIEIAFSETRNSQLS